MAIVSQMVSSVVASTQPSYRSLRQYVKRLRSRVRLSVRPPRLRASPSRRAPDPRRPRAPSLGADDPHVAASGGGAKIGAVAQPSDPGESAIARAAPPNSMPSSRLRATVGIAGAVLTITPLLGWVHVALLGSLNLLQILRFDGISTVFVWAGMLASAAVALTAFLSARDDVIRNTGATLGVVCGGGTVLLLIGAIRAVGQGDGLASVSIGPWVACIACAALTFGGFYRFDAAPNTPERDARQSSHPGQMMLSELEDGSRLSDLRRSIPAGGEVQLRADEMLAVLGLEDMSQAGREQAARILWDAGMVTYPSIARKGMSRGWRLSVCRRDR